MRGDVEGWGKVVDKGDDGGSAGRVEDWEKGGDRVVGCVDGNVVASTPSVVVL